MVSLIREEMFSTLRVNSVSSSIPVGRAVSHANLNTEPVHQLLEIFERTGPPTLRSAAAHGNLRPAMPEELAVEVFGGERQANAGTHRRRRWDAAPRWSVIQLAFTFQSVASLPGSRR
jgi:hypothetical protein